MIDENILTPYEKAILKEVTHIFTKHNCDAFTSRRICRVICDKVTALEEKEK